MKLKTTTWEIFKVYWIFVKKYLLFGVFVVIGLSLATFTQALLVPTYYKKFFDALQSDPVLHTNISILVSIITSIAFYNFIGWIGNRFGKFSLQKFEISVMRDVRQYAYDYVLDHSFGFFSNNFTGSLVQKINRFTRAFERIADRILIDIIPLVIKVIGVGIVLSFVDMRIAYIIYGWMITFFATSFLLNRMKLKYDIEGAATDSRVSAIISDSFSNHSAIQLFTGKESESKNFAKGNGDFARIFLKRWNIAESIDAILGGLNLAVEFLLFYFSIKFWEVGTLTLGSFVLIQAYFFGLTGSLWGFGRIVRDLYEATADAREMVEILKLPHEIQDIPFAGHLTVKEGAIDFKNVTFSFGQNKPVFNNFNLSIQAGEKVAIIGSSGAGKSTLVKLLLRLSDIQKGQICIDGSDIKTVTQKTLRENISLVPQDPALFHRTLMENIRYGRRDASDAEVFEASQSAHCDIFIKEFPLKYETFVGERGVKLSGGERQRVAIARALLKNAPILILDEATSSLDSHSEALIQDALQTLMKGKTTLVIAHRLSTIRKMDRIIVLGKDGVIEQGNHEDLIQKGGTYARLWNLQAGGFSDKSIEDLLEV